MSLLASTSAQSNLFNSYVSIQKQEDMEKILNEPINGIESLIYKYSGNSFTTTINNVPLGWGSSRVEKNYLYKWNGWQWSRTKSLESIVVDITNQLNFTEGKIILKDQPEQDLTAGALEKSENTKRVGWIATNDYFIVSGYNYIRYPSMILQKSIPVPGGLAFYDIDHNFISGHAFRVGRQKSCEIIDISIPENAYYARMSYFSSTIKSSTNRNISIRELYGAPLPNAQLILGYSATAGIGNIGADNLDLLTQAAQLGLHDIPDSQEQINIIKRARQLTDIKWTPAVDLPRMMMMRYNHTYFLGKFKAGVEYTGIPYTRTKNHKNNASYVNSSFDNIVSFISPCQRYGYRHFYVGCENADDGGVPLSAFVTGVQNEDSFLCKEYRSRFEENHNTIPFGLVCSKFASYIYNLRPLRDTGNIGDSDIFDQIGASCGNGTLKDIYEQDKSIFNGLKMGTLINQAGNHSLVLTDIFRNENDEITYVEISDSTPIGALDFEYNDESPIGGVARRIGLTVNEFVSNYSDYKVYAYNHYFSIPYSPNPYSPVGAEPSGLAPQRLLIMPYEGEGFKYKIKPYVKYRQLTKDETFDIHKSYYQITGCSTSTFLLTQDEEYNDTKKYYQFNNNTNKYEEDNNVTSSNFAQKKNNLYEGKIYNYRYASPGHYEETLDKSMIENKKYYKYNPATQQYEYIKNQQEFSEITTCYEYIQAQKYDKTTDKKVNDRKTYYERLENSETHMETYRAIPENELNDANISTYYDERLVTDPEHLQRFYTPETQYVYIETLEKDIVQNKTYYTIDNNNKYKRVANPIKSELNTYYEQQRTGSIITSPYRSTTTSIHGGESPIGYFSTDYRPDYKGIRLIVHNLRENEAGENKRNNIARYDKKNKIENQSFEPNKYYSLNEYGQYELIEGEAWENLVAGTTYYEKIYLKFTHVLINYTSFDEKTSFSRIIKLNNDGDIEQLVLFGDPNKNEGDNNKVQYIAPVGPNNYEKTSDTDIVSNKRYYIYDETAQRYVQKDNPQKAEIDTYYEYIKIQNNATIIKDNTGIYNYIRPGNYEVRLVVPKKPIEGINDISIIWPDFENWEATKKDWHGSDSCHFSIIAPVDTIVTASGNNLNNLSISRNHGTASNNISTISTRYRKTVDTEKDNAKTYYTYDNGNQVWKEAGNDINIEDCYEAYEAKVFTYYPGETIKITAKNNTSIKTWYQQQIGDSDFKDLNVNYSLFYYDIPTSDNILLADFN